MSADFLAEGHLLGNPDSTNIVESLQSPIHVAAQRPKLTAETIVILVGPAEPGRAGSAVSRTEAAKTGKYARLAST